MAEVFIFTIVIGIFSIFGAIEWVIERVKNKRQK